MSHVSREHGSVPVPVAGPTTRLIAGENCNALPIAQRLQILVRSGMHQALSSGHCLAEKSALRVETNNGVEDKGGWVVNDAHGKQVAALIPQALSRYRVHAIKGSVHVDLGIEVEVINGKLALYERTERKYQFLGRAPANIPGRSMSTAALHDTKQVRNSEWHEIVVPQLGLVTWNMADRRNAASGGFAHGWKGYYRGTKNDYPVFIKIVHDHETVELIERSDTYLREAANRSPSVSKFAPRSAAIWGEGARTLMGDDVTPGSAVIIEKLVAGPTLETLAHGAKGADGKVVAFTHPRQFATCAALVAQSLSDLNKHAAVGERLVAPDGTKPDNLMVTGFTRNTYGESIPIGLVCPDRDHFQKESHPQYVRGTFFYSDVRGLNYLIGGRDFSQVDQVHAYQIGRMLLGISLGKDFPPETTDIVEKSYAEQNQDQERQYKQAIAAFDKIHGTLHGTPGGELGQLIRDCCEFHEHDRPLLLEVEQRAHHIARMAD